MSLQRCVSSRRCWDMESFLLSFSRKEWIPGASSQKSYHVGQLMLSLILFTTYAASKDGNSVQIQPQQKSLCLVQLDFTQKSQARWFMLVIPPLKRLINQDCCKFKASFGCLVSSRVRLSQEAKKEDKRFRCEVVSLFTWC